MAGTTKRKAKTTCITNIVTPWTNRGSRVVGSRVGKSEKSGTIMYILQANIQTNASAHNQKGQMMQERRSKALEWYITQPDFRGTQILEIDAREGLIGITPTFRYSYFWGQCPWRNFCYEINRLKARGGKSITLVNTHGTLGISLLLKIRRSPSTLFCRNIEDEIDRASTLSYPQTTKRGNGFLIETYQYLWDLRNTFSSMG